MVWKNARIFGQYMGRRDGRHTSTATKSPWLIGNGSVRVHSEGRTKAVSSSKSIHSEEFEGVSRVFTGVKKLKICDSGKRG